MDKSNWIQGGSLLKASNVYPQNFGQLYHQQQQPEQQQQLPTAASSIYSTSTIADHSGETIQWQRFSCIKAKSGGSSIDPQAQLVQQNLVHQSQSPQIRYLQIEKQANCNNNGVNGININQYSQSSSQVANHQLYHIQQPIQVLANGFPPPDRNIPAVNKYENIPCAYFICPVANQKFNNNGTLRQTGLKTLDEVYSQRIGYNHQPDYHHQTCYHILANGQLVNNPYEVSLTTFNFALSAYLDGAFYTTAATTETRRRNESSGLLEHLTLLPQILVPPLHQQLRTPFVNVFEAVPDMLRDVRPPESDKTIRSILAPSPIGEEEFSYHANQFRVKLTRGRIAHGDNTHNFYKSKLLSRLLPIQTSKGLLRKLSNERKSADRNQKTYADVLQESSGKRGDRKLKKMMANDLKTFEEPSTSGDSGSQKYETTPHKDKEFMEDSSLSYLFDQLTTSEVSKSDESFSSDCSTSSYIFSETCDEEDSKVEEVKEEVKKGDEPKEDTKKDDEPKEGVKDHVEPQEGVKDHVEPKEDVKDHVDPKEDVKDHVEPKEDVKDHVEPKEDVKGHVEPKEDVKDHVEPKEDVKDHVEPKEDVKDHDEPKEDVKEHDEPKEDVGKKEPEELTLPQQAETFCFNYLDDAFCKAWDDYTRTRKRLPYTEGLKQSTESQKAMDDASIWRAALASANRKQMRVSVWGDERVDQFMEKLKDCTPEIPDVLTYTNAWGTGKDEGLPTFSHYY